MLVLVLISYNVASPVFATAWAGIGVAHISHLSSVFMLHRLTQLIFRAHPKASQIAFVSASLHVFSPAGLFLSAPYGESLFSLLHISGYYFYVQGRWHGVAEQSLRHDCSLLMSGLLIGLAATVRSNGLLGGLLYACDATMIIFQVLRTRNALNHIRQLAITVLAGSFVAAGALWPQYIAYSEFCSASAEPSMIRPWCTNLIPSIYSWVQAYYWYGDLCHPKKLLIRGRNNGFLRYWTLSNIPLFVLATPMLAIMARSAYWACWEVSESANFRNKPIKSKERHVAFPRLQSSQTELRGLMIRLALPQAVIALFALTSSHVQIITRLSSGYPVWYWWLADMVVTESGKDGQKRCHVMVICRWMVMYAIIQGGLYASFLPPA